MSTRSYIAARTAKGFEAIYCHHDGYPEGVGAVLAKHYADDRKVAALLALGDLSSLRPEIGEAHDFNAACADPNADDRCVAFGRDRGDTEIESKVHPSEKALLEGATMSWANYVYLWTGGEWLYRNLRTDSDWRELKGANDAEA